MDSDQSDQNKSFKTSALEESDERGKRSNHSTRQKTRNAVRAFLLWIITTGTASAFAAAAFIHQGGANPLILICAVALFAILFGYCFWKEYHRHNGVDGDGPDVNTS